MFWNNVKIALRNLRKNKTFAVINILGLAIGMTIYVFGGLVDHPLLNGVTGDGDQPKPGPGASIEGQFHPDLVSARFAASQADGAASALPKTGRIGETVV